MHRFVLAEFNTHRAFSRNSASSRAIPVEKQLSRLSGDPAWPIEWPSEQPGMQGGTALTGDELDAAEALFADIYDYTMGRVQGYLIGHQDKSTRLHKSVMNRVLEPFMWHKAIVSATEWENFFSQRCSPLAQPEIRAAAEAMQRAYGESVPQRLGWDDWHTPYVQADEMVLPLEVRKFISAARCARVSYLTHDGAVDIGKDIWLYQKLVSADPPHWSPLEHVATPSALAQTPGNFTGFEQLRHKD